MPGNTKDKKNIIDKIKKIYVNIIGSLKNTKRVYHLIILQNKESQWK